MKLRKKLNQALLFFSILLILFLPLKAASIQCVWTCVDKIVAVGDIHGAYKNFVNILKGTELIDNDLHWIGGKTHLVQTGDIMDRGPGAKNVFDLLIRLEKEAEEAGGKVHFLIGNHEEMNITGIAFDYEGYITVDQFVSFLPDKYRAKKEQEFRKKIAEKDLRAKTAGVNLENKLRNYWQQLRREDKEAQRKYIINFNEKYGQWLLKHNAVIKINDTIFVHGGISRKFSTWKLEDINNRLRQELSFLRRAVKNLRSSPIIFKPEIVYNSNGPLWYRGLALNNEQNFKSEVDEILHNLGAKHMVIAHTPRTGSKVITLQQMMRFQGKVWIIDTGISEFYGGFLSALIIEGDNFSIWGVSDEK